MASHSDSLKSAYIHGFLPQAVLLLAQEAVGVLQGSFVEGVGARLTDHVTPHPPVPPPSFPDKCVTGAVQDAPMTAAICSSTAGELRGTPQSAASVGSAAQGTAAEWSELAAVPASSSRTRSDSGLGTVRMVSFRTPWHSSACFSLRPKQQFRLLDETPEIIHAHSGQWRDKMCTLCSRRSWRRAPCTHRRVQAQRNMLRELARCPQRRVRCWPTTAARVMYPTTGAGTACSAGVGAMCSSTGAGNGRHFGRWSDVLHDRCWCCAQLAQARCTQQSVQVQRPMEAKAQCTPPQAQEHHETLHGLAQFTPRKVLVLGAMCPTTGAGAM